MAETGKGDDYFDYLIHLLAKGGECFEDGKLLPPIIKGFVKRLLVVSFNREESKLELIEEKMDLRMSFSE